MKAPCHALMICDTPTGIPFGLRLATIEDLNEAEVYDPETQTFGRLYKVEGSETFEITPKELHEDSQAD
jgi:hypothetical protein